MISSKRAIRRSLGMSVGMSVASLAAVALASLFAATAFAVNLIPGDIVVADSGAAGGTDGQVLRIASAGGTAEVIIGTGEGLVDPVSLAIESDGQILVLDAGSLEIYRVDPDAETVSTVVAAGILAAPTTIALNAAGEILVLDPAAFGNAGAIQRFSTTGTQLPTVSAGQLFPSIASGMVVEAAGTIVVTTTNGASPGFVVRVDPTLPGNANQTQIGNGLAPLANPGQIALDASGNLIFSDPGVPGLLGMGSIGGVAFIVSNSGTGTNLPWGSPSGLKVGLGGNVVSADAGTGLISIVDPTPPPTPNSNRTGISAGAPLVTPQGLDIATVPEPTALLAQGTALMVLGLIAARRRRA